MLKNYTEQNYDFGKQPFFSAAMSVLINRPLRELGSIKPAYHAYFGGGRKLLLGCVAAICDFVIEEDSPKSPQLV